MRVSQACIKTILYVVPVNEHERGGSKRTTLFFKKVL